MIIDLPDKLAIELKKIDWGKVTDRDLNVLIKIGVPFLELKGYIIKSEVKKNEHIKKNSP